jgi:pimeloyl-ACP methyl ester carboxylesterase
MTDTPSALASQHGLEPDLPPLAAVLIGVLLGGLGGFLFLTTRGGRVRHDITVASARLFEGLDSALGSWA